jgi:hypothetical protein
MLLINFLELGVVAGISQMLADRQYAVTLPRSCHGLEKSLSERHIRGMVCVNQTWPHCVNQMGKTQSKALAEWHGRGTAWYV